MNKIININLAGRLIPMEEPAYEELQGYLNSLRGFLANEEGAEEILHDMEDRIGELFQDKIKKGLAAITLEEVQEVKTIMGSPEEIANNEEEDNQKSRQKKESESAESNPASKHLSRSANEKVIGGVCGGLAAYFNIDPVIIRALFIIVTIFWGTGFLVYLVLWVLLPKEETHQIVLKRRWYRDTEHKNIAGVCSGIAGYFKIDPIWIRLIFISPIILGFGARLWGHLHILGIGIFPSMILLYLILWIILPKAESLTERLEASGKNVDLKNVHDAIQNNPGPKIHKRSAFASFIIFCFKAVMIFIGIIVLLVIISVVIALLLGALGIGTTSIFLLPITENSFGTPIQQIILIGSMILVVAIPVVLLIYFLIKVLSGRKMSMPRWASTSMIVLFIGGIFGLSSIVGNVLLDFRHATQLGQSIPLDQVTGDTLKISPLLNPGLDEVNSDAFNLNSAEKNVSLSLELSEDSSYHVILQKKSRGRNRENAIQNARGITYNFIQSENNISLPGRFELPAGAVYRIQRVKVIVQIPAGKYIRFGNTPHPWWNNAVQFRDQNGFVQYYEANKTNFKPNSVYKMNDNGVLQGIGTNDESQSPTTSDEL